MRRGLLLIAVLLLALPASASAATRYAAPAAGVTDCSQAAPCSLSEAVEKAEANDEVILLPGSYSVTASIEPTQPITIRGLGPREKPEIIGAPGIVPFDSAVPTTFRDLDVAANAEAAIAAVGAGSVFERLELFAVASEATALRTGGEFTLTNSLVVASGLGSAAEGIFVQGIDSGTPEIRNSTVIATDVGSAAIGLSVVNSDTSIAIAATNVIASGPVDARAVVGPSATNSAASIAFDHSNLDTWEGSVTSVDGQTAPPRFANAALRDYRQALDSPTINAGLTAAANGQLDLAGSPRVSQSELLTPTCSGATVIESTDIGAYQHLAPVPMIAPRVCVDLFPVAAPQTRIVKAKIRKRGAKFRFEGVGASLLGFECKLDKRPWRACASPRIYKRLKPGKHRFRVRAISAAGADASPAERKFRIKPRPRKSAAL